MVVEIAEMLVVEIADLVRNKSKVVLADGELLHTEGKGSRPSKVEKIKKRKCVKNERERTDKIDLQPSLRARQATISPRYSLAPRAL